MLLPRQQKTFLGMILVSCTTLHVLSLFASAWLNTGCQSVHSALVAWQVPFSLRAVHIPGSLNEGARPAVETWAEAREVEASFMWA